MGVSLATDGVDLVHLNISRLADEVSRAWVLRFHLFPHERARQIIIDDCTDEVTTPNDSYPLTTYKHIYPAKGNADTFFPFGGVGSAPARHAGPILELQLESSRQSHCISVQLESSDL